jgi:hypothetical protein
VVTRVVEVVDVTVVELEDELEVLVVLIVELEVEVVEDVVGGGELVDVVGGGLLVDEVLLDVLVVELLVLVVGETHGDTRKLHVLRALLASPVSTSTCFSQIPSDGLMTMAFPGRPETIIVSMSALTCGSTMR